MSGSFSMWRDDLAVGFAPIDAQHRHIASAIDQLYSAVNAGSPSVELERLFDGVIHATQDHFTAEEGLMLANGYPDYEEHRSQHRKVLEQLLDLKRNAAPEYIAGSDSLAGFVRSLTDQHIVFADKRLAAFLNRETGS